MVLKGSTPAWLARKYLSELLDRLIPLKTARVNTFVFRYPRKDSPPQDPRDFSGRSLEFHDRTRDLSGEIALDIGANIGSYTLPLAKRFRLVIAFEPDPTKARILKLNLALNELHNVRVEQLALSDSHATVPLYVRTGGATSLDPSHYGLPYEGIVSVKTARLDDFQSGMDQVDFVKIDAENAEYEILLGGRKVITRFTPTIALEVHQAREPASNSCSCKTCGLLDRLGYRIELIGESSSVGHVHWVWATPN